MIHQLKTKEKYFTELIGRTKTFEVRKNDRNFSKGDFVGLNEVDNEGVETGRWMLQKIIYILDNPEYCKEGYVILGLKDYRIDDGLSRPIVQVN
ncbi:MAG: DUF3850 domain-containing protein [Lachnospiraceae bacterium]|nr:DUF3850 domain-containing protein [Lachnospiraceae bacterium]